MITNVFGFSTDLMLTGLFTLLAFWKSFVSPPEKRGTRIVWKSLLAVAALWLLILIIVAGDYKNG
jgi:hypothetical protein